MRGEREKGGGKQERSEGSERVRRGWENTGESLWGLFTGLGCSREVEARGS